MLKPENTEEIKSQCLIGKCIAFLTGNTGPFRDSIGDNVYVCGSEHNGRRFTHVRHFKADGQQLVPTHGVQLFVSLLLWYYISVSLYSQLDS